jgi:hypothetical protein
MKNSIATTPSPNLTIARPDSDLDELAVRIRQENEQSIMSARTGLLHAKRAGELLQKARKEVAHGKWTTWVEANCSMSARTAQVYMQLAKRWSELDTKAQRMTDLTINAARELLAKPKPKKDAVSTVDTGSIAIGTLPVKTAAAMTFGNASPDFHPDHSPASNQRPGRSKSKPNVPNQLRKVAKPTSEVPPPKEDPDCLLAVLVKIGQRLALCVEDAHPAEHPNECAKALDKITKAVVEIQEVLSHA